MGPGRGHGDKESHVGSAAQRSLACVATAGGQKPAQWIVASNSQFGTIFRELFIIQRSFWQYFLKLNVGTSYVTIRLVGCQSNRNAYIGFPKYFRRIFIESLNALFSRNKSRFLY